MKKILAALSISLAFAAPVVHAQNGAPPAPAAADPAAVAAAQDMLASMNYRAVAQGMFSQMRQQMPAMMRQGATAAINNNPKLDAAQKAAAVAKLDESMPKAMAMIDGVFGDPTMLDDMMRETAQLYARHFTVAELHQIAAFYKTPVGTKMLTAMPQVMGEAMQISQRVVMPRVSVIMQKIAAGE